MQLNHKIGCAEKKTRLFNYVQMKYKPDVAKKVTSVIPSHAGSSYNPDFDAHQELLRKETDKELAEKKMTMRWFNKTKPLPKGKKNTCTFSPNTVYDLNRRIIRKRVSFRFSLKPNQCPRVLIGKYTIFKRLLLTWGQIHSLGVTLESKFNSEVK